MHRHVAAQVVLVQRVPLWKDRDHATAKELSQAKNCL